MPLLIHKMRELGPKMMKIVRNASLVWPAVSLSNLIAPKLQLQMSCLWSALSFPCHHMMRKVQAAGDPTDNWLCLVHQGGMPWCYGQSQQIRHARPWSPSLNRWGWWNSPFRPSGNPFEAATPRMSLCQIVMFSVGLVDEHENLAQAEEDERVKWSLTLWQMVTPGGFTGQWLCWDSGT